MRTKDYLVVGLSQKIEFRPIRDGNTLCEEPLGQKNLY